MDKPRGADHTRQAHYPLIDFLDSGSAGRLGELLARLLVKQRAKSSKLGGRGTRGDLLDIEFDRPRGERPTRPPGKGPDGPPLRERLHELFDGVSLCRFHGSVIHGRQRSYAYDIGLDSDKVVGFVVPNPFDTVITFGRARGEVQSPGKGVGFPSLDRIDLRSRTAPVAEAGEKLTAQAPRAPGSVRSGRTGEVTAALPARLGTESGRGRERPERKPPEGTRPVAEAPPICDLNLRLVVGQNNSLRSLQLYGPTVRIYFSRGLIQPVRKTSQGKYRPTGDRQGVSLGEQTITLARGATPRVSAPLVFEDNLVLIGGQAVVAILKQVTLGGSAAKPKLIFDRTELVL